METVHAMLTKIALRRHATVLATTATTTLILTTLKTPAKGTMGIQQATTLLVVCFRISLIFRIFYALRSTSVEQGEGGYLLPQMAI